MNSSENPKNQEFLVMWCTEGLETLINVTEAEQENIVAALKGESIPHRNPIKHMILRARFNQQRHYEIYQFASEIDEVSILDMFENCPQVIVDAIRQVGHKLYSDRVEKKKLIT
jgi:hypothetical protein